MATVAGAVPITKFTPAQQAQLHAGQPVGNFQVLNGHVMDTTTPAGRALLAQRTANQPPTPAATAPVGSAAGGTGRIPFTGPHGVPTLPQTPTPSAPDPYTEFLKQQALDAKLTGQHDALALISQTLAQYGLPADLADWAWKEIQGGKTMNEVTLDLFNPQTVGGKVLHQYFPEIQARQQAGLSPMSPGDIITWRNDAKQLMRAAGMPADFYDTKEDFTKFIVGNVSIKELGDRITMARDATFTMTPGEQARMYHEFGQQPGSGALTAFFFDPDRAVPLLQRDYNAAKIGGAADRAGYLGVGDETARQLATAGVSDAQAQQGFGALARESELFHALPGQGGEDISQQVQIGAQFLGDAAGEQQIERVARTRVAAFAGGGGFDTSREGVGGLGAAR